MYRDESFAVELNETVYALDSTTIDLCLSLFPWAQFRRQKRGQTAYAAGSARQHSDQCLPDQRRGARPAHSRSTVARSRCFLSARPRLSGFRAALRAATKLRFFITRAKHNTQFWRRDWRPVSAPAECAPIRPFSSPGPTAQLYPDSLRRIHYFDAEKDLRLIFLTNNFSFPRSPLPTCIGRAGAWSCFFGGSSSIFLSSLSSALRKMRSSRIDGRPRFVKRSLNDGETVKIAAIDPDFA